MSWYSQDQNDGRHIFVFGSNEGGRHGRGAAYIAKTEWGAKNGVGEGRQGQSYGIPTKDERLRVLPLGQIRRYVKRFIAYAEDHPDLTFLVTRIGCGLAGYSDEDVSPFFEESPQNCVLPHGWK